MSLNMTIYSLLSTQESDTGNRLNISEKNVDWNEKHRLQKKFMQNTPLELHGVLNSSINKDYFVASDSCI